MNSTNDFAQVLEEQLKIMASQSAEEVKVLIAASGSSHPSTLRARWPKDLDAGHRAFSSDAVIQENGSRWWLHTLPYYLSVRLSTDLKVSSPCESGVAGCDKIALRATMCKSG